MCVETSRCIPQGYRLVSCSAESLPLFPINFFLPPVNEVWGKVMFLHLSVRSQVGGGSASREGLPGGPACKGLHSGWLCMQGRGMPRGVASRGSASGGWADPPPGTRKAGDMHSFWMLTYLFCFNFSHFYRKNPLFVKFSLAFCTHPASFWWKCARVPCKTWYQTKICWI